MTWCTAVRELRSSVIKLTLLVINDNSTESNNSMSMSIRPVDTSDIVVLHLLPDTVYTSLLTVTVHGGQNITSQPATTHTTSGGFIQYSLPLIKNKRV